MARREDQRIDLFSAMVATHRVIRVATDRQDMSTAFCTVDIAKTYRTCPAATTTRRRTAET